MKELAGWFGLLLFVVLVAALCEPEKAARELGRAVRVFRAEVAQDAGTP